MTSRRDETGWLGRDLPRRVAMRPMPMAERVLLARALAERHQSAIRVADWRPLLHFTQGNPLTLTVLVGQALRQGMSGERSIAAFVEELERRQAGIDDEADELRERSLAASLGYGFEQAFNEQERVQLALLHLFQGFVDVDTLRAMGYPDASWCLPAVRGLNPRGTVLPV